MSSGKRVICLELLDKVYRDLEKLAYIKGTSVELVVVEAVNAYLSIARDIDAHYQFKYERVVEETRRILESAKVTNVKAENVALNLGKLVTLLKDTYGYIPREVNLGNLSPEERRKLTETLGRIGRSKVGGKEIDPVAYIKNRVRDVRRAAQAFGIEVVEENGDIKIVRFNNVNLIAMYYGYGVRALKRRLGRR